MQSYRPGFNVAMQWFTRTLYNSADQIVTVSEGIKKKLISDYQVNPEKCATIYNPVNIEKVQKLANEPAEERLIEIENEKYIVAIGRLVPQKGSRT